MNTKYEKLTMPMIHLNGTSRGELQRQYMEVYEAMRLALDALQTNGPHARDYYPRGDDAFNRARNEHIVRCQKLHSVKDEIEAIIVHLQK